MPVQMVLLLLLGDEVSSISSYMTRVFTYLFNYLFSVFASDIYVSTLTLKCAVSQEWLRQKECKKYR